MKVFLLAVLTLSAISCHAYIIKGMKVKSDAAWVYLDRFVFNPYGNKPFLLYFTIDHKS